MQRFRFYCVGLLASLWLCTAAVAQELPTELEARTVAAEYLDALGRGDIGKIKQLLGGQFLANRRQVLDNPSYSDLLSKRYGTATSTILGTEQASGGQIAVNAQIELSVDETLQLRLILARNADSEIKIIGEGE